MIKLNKHGMISKRLIAHEFAVGNTVVEGGGTPEELSVLSLTKDQLDALSYIVNGEGRIIPVGEDGTFDTKIGHSYCIRHTDDLTLHEAWLSNDENLYVKRYGSGQLLFFATSEKCKINDPSYIVTEVFRMAALNDFVDWSGIEHYQKWFKEIEVELTELLGSRNKFVLEIIDENTLMVHTDRVSDELLSAVKSTAETVMPEGTILVQYNHHIEVSWRDINKYATCTNIADFKAVNANYKNDLTSDGEWVYPLRDYVGSSSDAVRAIFQSSPMTRFDVVFEKIDIANATFNSCSKLKYVNPDTFKNARNVEGALGMAGLEECKLNLPKVTNAKALFWQAFSLRKANIYAPKLTTLTQICQNANNLKEISLSVGVISNAYNAFEGTQLNKDSVLHIFSLLGSYTSGTHEMKIGIHVDHKTDDEVLAAIAEAEAKGWTLTVQWNGTPTSTASTMAMGSLIYAKMGEHELPDGTSEQYIDWGHYVTNPECYETFRSLESAYKYFGLEMPEKEEN